MRVEFSYSFSFSYVFFFGTHTQQPKSNPAQCALPKRYSSQFRQSTLYLERIRATIYPFYTQLICTMRRMRNIIFARFVCFSPHLSRYFLYFFLLFVSYSPACSTHFELFFSLLWLCFFSGFCFNGFLNAFRRVHK